MDKTASPLSRRALPLGRQIRIVLIAALVVAGALVLSWGALRARATEPSQADTTGITRIPADEVRLTAAQLATLEIRPVVSRGFRTEAVTEGRIALNGDTTTQVFSPYSGRVLRVLAAPGESVKAGAALLRIDAAEYVQAESDLLNATATLKLARANEERKHAAYESKGGSMQDWQQAQTDLGAAETAFASAHDRLRIFGRTEADIAAIQSARKPDASTVVVAPIGGIITDRQVGPGQYLQSGSSTPVFAIGDLSTVWLVAEVREADAPLVERGQTVEVKVLAFPGRVFKATVTAVGAEVDPVTHRVPVRATIANPDGKLKPQMFATFSIVTSGDSQAPAVPEEAVVREGEEAHVWVVQQNDLLSLRAIRTGRISEGMVEVTSGLKPGEKIVTRGSLFIDRAAQPS